MIDLRSEVAASGPPHALLGAVKVCLQLRASGGGDSGVILDNRTCTIEIFWHTHDDYNLTNITQTYIYLSWSITKKIMV